MRKHLNLELYQLGLRSLSIGDEINLRYVAPVAKIPFVKVSMPPIVVSMLCVTPAALLMVKPSNAVEVEPPIVCADVPLKAVVPPFDVKVPPLRVKLPLIEKTPLVELQLPLVIVRFPVKKNRR